MIKFKRTHVIAKTKIEWLFLFLGVLLGGCQTKQSPKTATYSLVADIEGCAECQVRMYLSDYSNTKMTIDTTIKTGHFSLRGRIAQPGFYGFAYGSKVDRTVAGFVELYLPTDSVHLTATKKQIRTKFYQQSASGLSYLRNTVVFSTSPLQREWEQYLLARDSVEHKYYLDKALVVAKFNQTIGAGNRALMERWGDSARSFTYRFSGYRAAAAAKFIQQHPASVASLYAMLDNSDDRPAVAGFRHYYQAMPAPLRASYYGHLLDQRLARTESRNQNNQRFVGHFIDHLIGKTPTGQALAANQLFMQHKLTLIEFWASWCGPCRMEMPKYYKLYQQYKGQGFGMMGVSLDNDYNKWVHAIAEDSLRIPHLSELQGGNGEDIRRFDITGIPANILVDSRGKIVAVDIPWPKLKKHLQQAL
jgi:thiol-disulfide isomerase/thioredoxin